jgi:hypothetical protein
MMGYDGKTSAIWDINGRLWNMNGILLGESSINGEIIENCTSSIYIGIFMGYSWDMSWDMYWDVLGYN